MKKSIGFIGMGIMGSRMASNLLKNNFDVTVFNRDSEKSEPLKEDGASIATSVKEIANNSDIVFTMLSNPEAVKKVAFGEKGFLKHMKEGSLWVDCSTVNPSFTKEIAKKVLKKKIRFIDAPVSGSLIPAEKGELVFLVGGENDDVKEISPMLKAMGKMTHHVGPVGMGSAMKLVINLMLGNAMAAFAEAVALGDSFGIDPEKAAEILVHSPVTSPFLAHKHNKMKENNYETEFPLKHMYKDMFLATTEGLQNKLPLRMTNAATKLYSKAYKNKLADKDFSAVYETIKPKKK